MKGGVAQNEQKVWETSSVAPSQLMTGNKGLDQEGKKEEGSPGSQM